VPSSASGGHGVLRERYRGDGRRNAGNVTGYFKSGHRVIELGTRVQI